MRKTLQYGESWELATLKLATLLVGNVGTRSQLVGRLSKHEYMSENHYSRSVQFIYSKIGPKIALSFIFGWGVG